MITRSKPRVKRYYYLLQHGLFHSSHNQLADDTMTLQRQRQAQQQRRQEQQQQRQEQQQQRRLEQQQQRQQRQEQQQQRRQEQQQQRRQEQQQQRRLEQHQQRQQQQVQQQQRRQEQQQQRQQRQDQQQQQRQEQHQERALSDFVTNLNYVLVSILKKKKTQIVHGKIQVGATFANFLKQTFGISGRFRPTNLKMLQAVEAIRINDHEMRKVLHFEARVYSKRSFVYLDENSQTVHAVPPSFFAFKVACRPFRVENN